jgi:hypothetical protein
MLLLQEAWTAPSLRMVCDQLAGAWAIAEAVTTLLSLVGVGLQAGCTVEVHPHNNSNTSVQGLYRYA